MSHDPAGYHDSVNLYQYVFNNPFKYCDPDGQFVFAIPLLVWGSTWALPTFSAIITPIIYSAAIATASYCGYKAAQGVNKIIDAYAPDRDLPSTKDGVPVPDEGVEGAHTQLGTRNGTKGKYTKAREFDKNGKPVRDIEFTDHGRPTDHPCPHQHKYIKNKTGGSDEVVDATPLQDWKY